MSRWQYQGWSKSPYTEPIRTNWMPSYPSLVFGRRILSTAILAGACFFTPLVETITLDKWSPSYPIKVDGKVPRQPHLNSCMGSFVPLAETIKVDKWSPSYQSIVKGKEPRRPYLDSCLTFTHQPEAITSDKWQPSYPSIVKGRDFSQPHLLKATSELLLPEDVTLDKWQAEYPDQISSLKYLVAKGWSVVSPLPPVTAEVITSDKWYPSYPSIVLGKGFRKPWLDKCSTDFQVEDITCNKWLPSYPYKAESKGSRKPYLESCIYQPEGTIEVITLDKWYMPPPGPIIDKQRWQHLYPSFTADAQLFQIPVPPTTVLVYIWKRTA